jgi:catechol 2,3-dioxygenase-like lactoylglutathione lyase family enzyme
LTKKHGRSIFCCVEIDHLIVPVSDYEAGKRFYERALAPLGFSLSLDWPDQHRAYFGLPGEPSSLWLVESPAAGSLVLSLPAQGTNGVVGFHAAAVAAGASAQRGPAVDRERSSYHYAACVLDPDGNALEVVYRGAARAAAQQPSLAA